MSMPNFKIIELLVSKKKIVKVFGHLWVWRPSLSCDRDHFNKIMFLFPMEARHKI